MGKDRDAVFPVEETDEGATILSEGYRGGIGEEEPDSKTEPKVIPTSEQ